MMRCDYPPEIQRSAVHAALRMLQAGDMIPPHIYVADYATGEIPTWLVHSRQERNGLVEIVAFDMSNTYVAGSLPATQDGMVQFSLFGDGHTCYPAVCILSGQRKTLRCHPVEFNGDWPNTLCDMVQQATHIGGKRKQPALPGEAGEQGEE